MIKKYGDLISGSVFLLFALFLYFAAAYTIPPNNVTKYGADVVPKVTAAIMFALSLSVIAGGWRKARRLAAAREGGEGERINYLVVLLSFACIGAYVFSMSYLGFLIATGLYLLIQMIILSNFSLKRLPLFLVIAIGFSAGTYYFFTEALYLLLPSGLLG